MNDAQEAYVYLSRVLQRHAPQCNPLTTLTGLATQIDNLLAGAPQVQSDAASCCNSERSRDIANNSSRAQVEAGDGRAARLQTLLTPFMRRWLDNPNASSYLWTLVEAYEPELPGSSRRQEMLNAVRQLEAALTLAGQPEGK